MSAQDCLWCVALTGLGAVLCCDVPCRAMVSRLPDDSHIQALEVLQLSPIMYYRPAHPEGLPYLKCSLPPGALAWERVYCLF